MKAISVKQPWASLIVHGIKDIENRTWVCPKKYIGQRVLIHASLKCANFWESPVAGRVDEFLREISKSGTDWSNYPNGAIIGSVVFTDCVQNHPSIWAEKTQFYVELEEGVYLTSGKGDPSRTVLLEHAHLYASEQEANRALLQAKKYRPFINAKVIASNPIYNWVASAPILFDKPIAAKGKLSFWDYPNINYEEDEVGRDVCCCNLGIPKYQQVLSYGNGYYRCKYCGGKWYI